MSQARSKRRLSRRAFLKGAGVVAAATGASAVLDLDDKYLHVPPAPKTPPDPNALLFFTPEEARMVGRIMP
ncbi:MAG: twin-arginine translocation signal domain-containing protein [Anaerolineales bacterium]